MVMWRFVMEFRLVYSEVNLRSLGDVSCFDARCNKRCVE